MAPAKLRLVAIPFPTPRLAPVTSATFPKSGLFALCILLVNPTTIFEVLHYQALKSTAISETSFGDLSVALDHWTLTALVFIFSRNLTYVPHAGLTLAE